MSQIDPPFPPECLDPTIKSRSRMHWRIADHQVISLDPGARAVLADFDGNLTETSSGNLFVLKDGDILTPPADRVLNGISRQVVMELATAAGYTVKEQLVPIELALEADEIWTTSTPYCMLPVSRFNESKISGGKPGPVFQQNPASLEWTGGRRYSRANHECGIVRTPVGRTSCCLHCCIC